MRTADDHVSGKTNHSLAGRPGFAGPNELFQTHLRRRPQGGGPEGEPWFPLHKGGGPEGEPWFPLQRGPEGEPWFPLQRPLMALSAHAVDEIKSLPPRFPELRSAVIPALDIAQEELGYLTSDAMSEVAELLQVDPGYVEGVATFYSLFHLEPTGSHHFYVCTNLSCTLRGAVEICDHIKRRIGVEDFNEVSADGLFSVEEVECLGACEYAPMMRYQQSFHYDLTPDKVDTLIDAARQGTSKDPHAHG